MQLLLAASLITTETTLVVIGSQAGAPGFKEAMEAKEGKGAVDNELGYIQSMVSVREWALEMQRTGQVFDVQLEEPALVDTPLVRREFSHFGIDWTEIQKPLACAEEVLARNSKL